MSKDIDTLSLVKEAFAHWRTTRLKQGKIPDYLWEQVRELLNDYPIATICSALSISSVQIREKLLPKEDVAIQFVEVKEALTVDTRLTQVGQGDVCAIELQRPCGSIFKVTRIPVSLVSQLISDFMR
ncbi:hypothetical protein [Legionella pneumophila]|uniref:hypothetical protein n=1 Tax=Legionella pneumophila TaxID=446 RepID=UPI0002C0FC67|nr:hypothetical protein [Legionella pneumophila]AGH55340.1 putative protein [Legionella pneumophila subsp. pneumophila LPE509]